MRPDALVARVELHVMVKNERARVLYRELGWTEEVVQMVWDIGCTPQPRPGEQRTEAG